MGATFFLYVVCLNTAPCRTAVTSRHVLWWFYRPGLPVHTEHFNIPVASLTSLHSLLVQIVGIVAAVLVAMGSKTDYATGFLDLVVYLMQQGCVGPALTMITNWASRGSAHPSLVKHFVFKTLAVCGPPYSSSFIGMMLRYVKHAQNILIQYDDLCLHRSHPS